MNVNIINNTIISNDTTASAGVLFNTLGAPLASTQQNPCIQSGGTTASCPQVAGLVSVQNSATLKSSFPATITCPAGHFAGTTAANGSCKIASYPELYNNVLWQNRSFFIGVGSLGGGTLNQQNLVALFNASGSVPGTQTATGACPGGSSYWDIGVRGDSGPADHSSSVTLSPEASILTSITGYTGEARGSASMRHRILRWSASTATAPASRRSSAAPGWQVPPGISDATVPNPIFNLTPAATVDEGNNWVNISWGPLAMASPSGTVLGNYALTAGSPAISYITAANSATTYAAAPSTDFFGNARKANGAVDVGAVEFQVASIASLSVTPTSLAFGNVPLNTTSAANTLTLANSGGASATGLAISFTGPFARPAGAAGGTCGATLAANATCTINVTFAPGTTLGLSNGSAVITANVSVSGSPVALSGTGVADVTAATLTPTSRNFGNATRGVGVLAAPTQVFTLTNTGNVTLTGITQGTLGGINATEFSIVRLTSTCGPAGGGQVLGQTTLAPGASCVVTVQFRPQTAQTTGAKSATVSVTDLAGTQTSTLTGNAQ